MCAANTRKVAVVIIEKHAQQKPRIRKERQNLTRSFMFHGPVRHKETSNNALPMYIQIAEAGYQDFFLPGASKSSQLSLTFVPDS